ncbi:MAG TPA: hypothetical protein V6C89_05570 [Drouetiella sp.]|jgi:poly(3-hydroxybutyrate) depolymerase
MLEMRDFAQTSVAGDKQFGAGTVGDTKAFQNANGISQFDGPWEREARLAHAALQSIPKAAAEAFSPEHLPETAGKAALSAAATLALTCVARQPGLGATAMRVLAPAAVLSLGTDLVRSGSAIFGAAADTWESGKNWEKNKQIVDDNVGRFAVDFAINSAAGGIAHVGGSRYFGWTPGSTRGLPELSSANLLSAAPGETTAFKLKSDGIWRRVDVHLPEGFDGKIDPNRNLLVGLDGILVNKQPGMAGTNGLGALMDRTGDIGVFPHAGSFNLVPGVRLTSWQSDGAGFLTPGHWLVPKSKVDDTQFISDVISQVKGALNTDRSVLVGFSEGGNVSHNVAAKLGKNMVQGVGSVEGTVTGIEHPAIQGMDALIVHGTADPTIPIQGGAGGLTKILSRLGHTRMENSQPLAQISRYTEANQFTGQPVLNSSQPGVTETIYPRAQMGGGGEVRYIELDGGKHAYSGRSVGRAEDKSVLSGVNGGPTSFQINDTIADLLLRRTIAKGS